MPDPCCQLSVQPASQVAGLMKVPRTSFRFTQSPSLCASFISRVGTKRFSTTRLPSINVPTLVLTLMPVPSVQLNA